MSLQVRCTNSVCLDLDWMSYTLKNISFLYFT